MSSRIQVRLIRSGAKIPDPSTNITSETVHLLIGMVDWSMALITFIIDEVFMLGDLIEDHGDIADDLALDRLNERSNYN